jgi:hypothetical protein
MQQIWREVSWRVDSPVWSHSEFVAKANYVLSLSISDREIFEVTIK